MKRIWVKRLSFSVLAALFGLLSGCLFFPPPPPENVSASDGEYPDFVLILWSASPRASRYEVFRAIAKDGEYEKIGEATTARFEDKTASPNVLYWYKVRACNAFGCSGLSSADQGFWLGPVPPSTPQNVEASDGAFPDRIRVTWSPSLGAAYYYVWRTDLPGAAYRRLAQVSGTSYEDTDVLPGRTYYYKVQACNEHGCSDLSEADAGSAAAEPPAAPQNVQASDGTFSDRVRVTWSAVPGAARYEVHRATSQAGPYELRGETTSTSYDDTGVTVGTTYWYKVRAWNVFGYGDFSEPDSGYAAAGGGGGGGGGGGALLPGQPWNLAATDGTYDDKIVITWRSASGAKRYELWRAKATDPTEPDEGDYELIAETTSTSYTDTEPGLCELYWYKVRAWNEYGYGPWSFADSGYTAGKLKPVDSSKIQKLVLPLSGGYKVYLKWPNAMKAEEVEKYKVAYEVWRWRVGQTPTCITTTPISGLDSTGKALEWVSFTDSNVEEDVTYYYKIRTVSKDYANLLLPDDGPCPACGTCIAPSAFSGEVAVVVTCNPVPPELKSATYDATGTEKKVVLTWTNPYAGTDAENQAKFEVWRATSLNGPYTKIAWDLSQTTYEDATGLVSGTTYYYKVKTCFDCDRDGHYDDCGPFSNVKSVTIPKS
ncbi:hypothetical protein H5T56_01625 [Candidatus Bipolaricaulota bacterium]|nr:hypothetical protein [Candidatus Bipolaricaulota bacterium]